VGFLFPARNSTQQFHQLDAIVFERVARFIATNTDHGTGGEV
jgi:hypothetical protein